MRLGRLRDRRAAAPGCPRSGGRGNLASLALALVTVVGLLALAEGAFWALDLFPAPPGASKLRYQTIALPLFTPQRLPDGRQVLATSDPRLPFQWFDAEKPADEKRIFFFGGSAMAGLGYSPNVTLARELEALLAEDPASQSVRVFNLGVVAFASRQVSAMVDDVLDYGQPDLLIVYSGNNEFLEIHSLAYARAVGLGPNPLQRCLGQSRLKRALAGGQKLDRAALEASVSTRDLRQNDARVEHAEMMAKVDLSEQQTARVFEEYRQNLAHIASAAERAGVPLVLCTVASNWEWAGLKDQSAAERLGYSSDPDPEDEAGRRALLERIERDLPEAPAKRRFEFEYEAARLHLALGDVAGANPLFRAALVHDPACRRAQPAHAALVRWVASKSNAQLVDLAQWAEDQGGGRVGFDLFYDYVHFTPRGIALATRNLAERLFERQQLFGLERPETWPITPCQLAGQGELQADGFPVDAFLGFGDDPARLRSKNLWKYDETLDALDARIQADPSDWMALCWRANAAFFRPDGLEAARADYEAAETASAQDQSAAAPNQQIRENLRRLTTDRRP